jgi:hypothetical protein
MGSVVVDDDGFIYVADRTRIQKFAPWDNERTDSAE